MTYSSTKFDSAIIEVLYNMTIDSCQDDEIGESDSMGWFARFDGSISREDADKWAKDDGFDVELTEQDYKTMENCVGAIICVNSQGFVGGMVYSSAAELMQEWINIENMYAEEDENDDDDDE